MCIGVVLQALDDFLRNTRARHLSNTRLLQVPFGGVRVIMIGNCLQMPPISTRIDRRTDDGHLYMVPTDPSYVWLSPLVQALPQDKVLKVGTCCYLLLLQLGCVS
jgi:hypothetical protein